MGSFAAAFVLLIPVVLTPRLLFYYDLTPKVALLIGAAILCLLTASIHLSFWIAFARTRWGRLYLLALAGFAACAGIAALLSPDRSLAWYGSNWRRSGTLTEWVIVLAALWVARYAIRGPRDLLTVLRAICAAGLVAALYGIAQYFGWDPVLSRDAYEVGEGVYRIVRPPGTLGHSDYFAAFLLWPAFAGLALGAAECGRGWKWFALGSAAAASAGIVLSGSRGALLGLVCGIAVRILLQRPNRRRSAAAFLATSVAFAAFYVSPMGERLRARVHWIREEPAGGSRLLLWRDSLQMAAKRPLTGFGPDAFVAAFPKFESIDLARAYPDFFHESPHNLPLDVLTGEGVPGLLAFAALLFSGIAGGVRVRQSHSLLALAFLPGLAAALVAHQFAVWIPPTAFFLFLAAGALAGAGANEIPGPRTPWILRSVVMACGCAAAAGLGLAGYRMVSEDHLLAEIDRRLDQSNLTAAAQAYRVALSRPSAGITADLYFSRRWSKVAMGSPGVMPKFYYSQIAAGAGTRATQQPEQRPNAWYNLAVLSAARNDAPGTEYALRAAIAEAPHWYKPRWILARLLSGQGRATEAAHEAAEAVELNGDKDMEVASTLVQVLRSASPSP